MYHPSLIRKYITHKKDENASSYSDKQRHYKEGENVSPFSDKGRHFM